MSNKPKARINVTDEIAEVRVSVTLALGQQLHGQSLEQWLINYAEAEIDQAYPRFPDAEGDSTAFLRAIDSVCVDKEDFLVSFIRPPATNLPKRLRLRDSVMQANVEELVSNDRLLSDLHHPFQPLGRDAEGLLRFKKNTMVEFMFSKGCISLSMDEFGKLLFPLEDREQFVQLLGCSLTNFSNLPYVRAETYSAVVQKTAISCSDAEAKVSVLQHTLDCIRDGLRIAVPHAFKIDSEDLHA